MKYFTFRELTASQTARRYGIDNTPPERYKENLRLLTEKVLDPIREAWGAPIIVTSGYRCEKLNRLVKGKDTSMHLVGKAADIRTLSDERADNAKLLKLIIKLVNSGKVPFDQLISEYPDKLGRPDWIHISYDVDRNRKQMLTCKKGLFYSGITVG